MSNFRCSVSDYLRFERASVEKHDYRKGQMAPATGGPPVHSLICANIGAEMGCRLRGTDCRVYASTLRVCITSETAYVYPDASVICGRVEYDLADEARETVINPSVIIEVLSADSEADDRDEKFWLYRQAPSVGEVVLVSPTVPAIETYMRRDDGTWTLRVFYGIDAVARLQTLAIDVPLAEVFAGVDCIREQAIRPVSF